MLTRGQFCAVVIGCISMASAAWAQQVGTSYTLVNYYKVAPEKMNDFIAFAESDWKKVNQMRADAGVIKGWAFMKVVDPSAWGADAEYNFVAAFGMGSFPVLDRDELMEAEYQKAGFKPGEFTKRMRALATPVKRNISRGVLSVGAFAEKGNYLKWDYHLTPSDRPGELIEIEQRIYAPMFKSIAEAGGGLRGWAVTEPVLPNANERGYTFATSQVFKDFESFSKGAGVWEDVFKRTHPDLNVVNERMRLQQIDKIVSVRVLHVLEVVRAATTPSATK